MKSYKLLLSSKAIALMLLLFGYGWIITSDFIAANVNGTAFSLFNIQILKGLLFVTVASAGVYALLYLKDKELKQGRRFTDSILQTIDVAILVITEEGVVDSVNSAFSNIFGYTKNEIVGKHFTKLLPEERIDKGYHNFNQLLEDHTLPDEEWDIYNKDGNPLSLLVDAHVLQNDEEKFLLISATDITQQKEIQSKLEHSLLEKEVLLSEVHHRVKNNLAIVSGLMQLQLYEADNPELKEKLATCTSRIQTIGSIHELLYQSNSLSQLHFDKSIEQLVKNLREMFDEHQEIDFNLNLSPVTININQGVPACLVINEIVTNALQHAFSDKEQGVISIDLSKSDDEVLTLTISDNGKGLPDHFNSISENGSLGFQLVDTLLKQLHADITVDTSKEGTTFTISFEKTSHKGSNSGFAS